MKIAVIGGGPAGLFAAYHAAKGNEVTLLERNEKLGKKLYITGKGRCNLTNSLDLPDFFDKIVRNHEFLYSSLYQFTNADTVRWFESRGLPIKEERGGRMFPRSDKSSDVIRTLEEAVREAGVTVLFHTRVEKLERKKEGFLLTLEREGQLEKRAFDRVILATGGKSYPSTGSTGDGYRFAKELGHTVTALRPSLVPFNLSNEELTHLTGATLKNVELTAKTEHEEWTLFGDLLFTQFGISGPIVLEMSALLEEQPQELSLNLKPAVPKEEFERRLIHLFAKAGRKELKTVLETLTIKNLVPVLMDRAGVQNKRASEVTKEERKRILDAFYALKLDYVGMRSFKEAIITRGGVDVDEVDPSTLESRLVPGLYFAGEILDVDAVTGGYNLQIAFSTGYLAGRSAGEVE